MVSSFPSTTYPRPSCQPSVIGRPSRQVRPSRQQSATIVSQKTARSLTRSTNISRSESSNKQPLRIAIQSGTMAKQLDHNDRSLLLFFPFFFFISPADGLCQFVVLLSHPSFALYQFPPLSSSPLVRRFCLVGVVVVVVVVVAMFFTIVTSYWPTL